MSPPSNTKGLPNPEGDMALPALRSLGSSKPLSPVRFSVSGKPGVSLQAALCRTVAGLDGGDECLALDTPGAHLTLRIHWPGYDPWIHPISFPAANSNLPTKSDLVYRVAIAVRTFYCEMANTTCAQFGWEVQDVPFEQLHLVELRWMEGVWQVVLARRMGA